MTVARYGLPEAEMRRRLWRVAMWAAIALATVFVTLTIAALAGIGWVATHYDKENPWNITRWTPRLEALWSRYGLDVAVSRAELWFDEGLVLRVNGVEVYGPDGELAVVVDQAAVKLAHRRLLALIPAFKVIEGNGVTLRVVRDQATMRIAGLGVMGGDNPSRSIGAVDWLNGLGLSAVWGQLRDVRISGLTLLLRDDVQNAEWVLEDGTFVFDRYGDVGERASIVAQIRRLYGGREVPTMPVLVTMEHPRGASSLTIEARLDGADFALVADYMPEVLHELLRGKGQLVVGTSLGRGNRLGQPWVTVRLKNVALTPPVGYSKPLVFDDLLLSASYLPLPRDELAVRRLVAETTTGLTFEVSGTVTGLSVREPVVDLGIMADKGKVEDIVALFPDEVESLARARAWLTENIEGARFANLRGTLDHNLTQMKNCHKDCGLDLYADVVSGKVEYADGFPAAEVKAPGTFYMGNGGLVVRVPEGTTGTFEGRDIVVELQNMFTKPSPTEVHVNAEVAGRAEEVVASLERVVGEASPVRISGSLAGRLGLRILLVKGRPVIIDDIFPAIDARLEGAVLEGIPALGETRLENVGGRLAIGERVDFSGQGSLRGNLLQLQVQDGFWDFGEKLHIRASGDVPLAWVADVASAANLSGQGQLGLAATLDRKARDVWAFGGRVDGRQAEFTVPLLDWRKPMGSAVTANLAGSVATDAQGGLASVVLDKIDVQGNGINVQGSLQTGPTGIERATLKPLRLGANDADVVWNDRAITVTGRALDLSGMDVFGGERTAALEDGNVSVDVARLRLAGGEFRDVEARLHATGGRWQVDRFTGLLGEKGRINIVLEDLEGQPGRQVLRVNINQLGQVLRGLGLYDQLEGGDLFGDITYDSPDVGGGVLVIRDFQLRKPPLLMQILGLLSLEQLVAGTDTVIFSRADLPVRLDGPWVYLDRAHLQGPSLSMRLDGSYHRDEKQVNMDGALVPALPLNRLVTKIPLVGGLLSGSQDGVVVADFKVKGPTDDLRVSVKPLSVLTPGLLKDFWRGLTGSGSSAAPPPRVQDGLNAGEGASAGE